MIWLSNRARYSIRQQTRATSRRTVRTPLRLRTRDVSPCSPPSSAELSGEVGEHCLSLAQRGELRSRPTGLAAQGTLRVAQGGRVAEIRGSPPCWLLTLGETRISNSPAERDRRGGSEAIAIGRNQTPCPIPTLPLRGGRSGWCFDSAALRLSCAKSKGSAQTNDVSAQASATTGTPTKRATTATPDKRAAPTTPHIKRQRAPPRTAWTGPPRPCIATTPIPFAFWRCMPVDRTSMRLAGPCKTKRAPAGARRVGAVKDETAQSFFASSRSLA
jgi:hypothetical protein